MVEIYVNEQPIQVPEGTSLLSACLANGYYIPNLCYLKTLDRQSASCRMCFVEIEGRDQPVAACTETVTQSLVVKTDTDTVRRLQKSALQLLLSVHRVECKDCPANRNCGLQTIAKFLNVGLKQKNFSSTFKQPDVDSRHPCMDYYPNRCILCGKCVRVCRQQHGVALLSFAQRGFNTVISVYPHDHQAKMQCHGCLHCVEVCPVGALLPKSQQQASSSIAT